MFKYRIVQFKLFKFDGIYFINNTTIQQMGFPAQNSKKNNKEKRKQVEVLTRDIYTYRPQLYALSENYFTIPSQQYLFSNNGKSQILIIGNEFGRAEWRGNIDLSRLASPLSQTVFIGDRQIEVYIGDLGKPPRGMELNRSCLVTFYSNNYFQEKNLRKICRENHTSLTNCNPEINQFTVAIPHFTQYTFNDKNVQKKEAVERNRMSDVVVGRPRRNRSILNVQNQLPLTSIRQEQAFNGEIVQRKVESNGIGLIFQGLKELIVGNNSKFIEKEVPFPNANINENQKILAIENQNRKIYGFSSYQHSVYNFPLLQNMLMYADGGIAKLKNYQNYQNLHIKINKNNKKQSEMMDLGFESLLLLKEELTPQLVSVIITDKSYQFSVRRLLSLHSLLFSKEICFKFIRDKDYSIISIPRYFLNDDRREELIKDWITWTIRQLYDDSSPNRPAKTKLMNALAMRMPQRAVDLLLVNNKWMEAQVIANLQDSQFRQNMPQDYLTDLESDVQKLLKDSVEALFGFGRDWLINLGLNVWYRRGGDLFSQVAEVINYQSRHGKMQKSWGLQFRLFQLFVVSKKLQLYDGLYLTRKKDRETVSAQWIISNLLDLGKLEGDFVQKFKKNGRLLYRYYCYQVTLQVIEPFMTVKSDTALDIISASKGLQENSKQELVKMVRERNRGVLELINKKIGEGNLIEGLRLCVQGKEIKEQVVERMYSLATNPELLINYRREISDKIIQLLSLHQQYFADLLLILQFQRDASVGLKEFKRIIDIYEGFSKFNVFLNGQVRRTIISKISMCLASWVSKRPDLIINISQDVDLFNTIKKMLKSSEIQNYFSDVKKRNDK